MKPFTRHHGIAAPLLRVNVDTDQIIPSREMKTVGKKGLAAGLFAGWRYRGDPAARDPDPDFVLNRPEYAGASILIGGANFGCGSSREHAVWALAEYGIRCIVAPGFGAIFRNNCIRNGLLPVVLAEDAVRALAARVEADPRRGLDVDLERGVLTGPDGKPHTFTLDAGSRRMLLEGLDAIGQTLKLQDQIAAFTARDRAARPWAYSALAPGDAA